MRLIILNFMLTAFTFSSLVYAADNAQKMKPDAEGKCRQTEQFKKMCAICRADKGDRASSCLADVSGHGSSPEFMELVHAINKMETACGYKVPANSCVRGLLGRIASICRGEERIPDIKLLIEPGNCN
jgi:hypothetical protein